VLNGLSNLSRVEIRNPSEFFCRKPGRVPIADGERVDQEVRRDGRAAQRAVPADRHA